MDNKNYKQLISEPYRIFFPFGIVAALLGSSYWIFVYLNIFPYSPIRHGLIQSELFGGAFVVGFLMTAIPKFSRTAQSSTLEVVGSLSLYGAAGYALLCDTIAISQISFALLMGWLLIFGVKRFQQRKSNPPPSFALVAFGIIFGLTGAALIAFPIGSLPFLGYLLVERGMLLSLTLGVGAFLGPRLMGTVDTANAVVSFGPSLPTRSSFLKDPFIFSTITGTVLLLSFLAEAAGYEISTHLIRAAIATTHLWYFGALKLPQTKSIVGKFVAAALWMTLLGLWVSAIYRGDPNGVLHISFIGGFALLIIGIGTQVSSSHGGESEFWNHKSLQMTVISALIVMALLLRVVAIHCNGAYLPIIATSAGLFASAIIFWGTILFRLFLPFRK